MPEKIIRRFQQEYGTKKGKSVFYATANAQGRNPETFKKIKGKVNAKRKRNSTHPAG